MFEQIVEELKAWGPATMSENGATMVLHTPHRAPEAYFHILYPPLSDAELANLEREMGRPLPPSLVRLYRVTNGVDMFGNSLSFYGKLRTMRRTPSHREPFDLTPPNRLERPRGVPPEHFKVAFVGTGSGSHLWCDPDGVITQRPRGEWKTVLATWPSLEAAVRAEVDRLTLLFDRAGRPVG